MCGRFTRQSTMTCHFSSVYGKVATINKYECVERALAIHFTQYFQKSLELVAVRGIQVRLKNKRNPTKSLHAGMMSLLIWPSTLLVISKVGLY